MIDNELVVSSPAVHQQAPNMLQRCLDSVHRIIFQHDQTLIQDLSQFSWVKIFVKNIFGPGFYLAPWNKGLKEWKLKSRNHCNVHQAGTGGGFWQDRTTNTAEGKLWLNVASCTQKNPPNSLFANAGWDENTSPEFLCFRKLPERKIKHRLWPERTYICPFAYISWQVFAQESFSMNISHLLQLCMSVTINVNHISLWALSWLPVLHVCLSFLLLFVHLLCLSLRVFLCRCCPPPFHCDSVWLFGL